MKRCSQCLNVRPLNDFLRTGGAGNRRNITKYFKMCNDCHGRLKKYAPDDNADRQKLWAAKRKAEGREKKREWTDEDKKIYQERKSSNVCNVFGCEKEKLVLGYAHGKCEDHGGIDQVFRNICPRGSRNEKQKWKYDVPENDLITLEFLKDLYKKQNMICFYCGIPILLKKGTRNRESVSLDRIDSKIPYIKENVVITCGFCNDAKNQSNIGDFVNTLNIIFDNEYSDKSLHSTVPMTCCWTSSASRYIRHCENDHKWNGTDFKNLAETQQFKCAITGIDFCFCHVSVCPKFPSLDRISNDSNHIPTNSHLILTCLNFGRNQFTLDELKTCIEKRKLTYKNRLSKQYDHILTDSTKLSCSLCFIPENPPEIDETLLKKCGGEGKNELACGEMKPLSDFNWHNKKKGIKRTLCRKCQIKENKKNRIPKRKRMESHQIEMDIQEGEPAFTCRKCNQVVPERSYNKSRKWCKKCGREWEAANKKEKAEMSEGHKYCPECNMNKPNDDFPPGKKMKMRCKTCKLEIDRKNKLAYYHKNKKRKIVKD